MESASYQSARRFGWVPQEPSTPLHCTNFDTQSGFQDDAELMNPWAETAVLNAGDQELAYWVPFTSELPPTIIKRSKRITPIQVSPKLKYPMMVALTVATISSGSILQALSSPTKAAPSGNDGTGSFQPVDGTQNGDEISAAPASGDGGTIHAVVQGDTLRDIANQYGVDLSSLVAANGLANPDLIHPGDQIQIPGNVEFAETMVTYTVQAGDSLRSIASAHGVSYTAIVNYESNGITNADLIYPGQELTIPGGTAPVATAVVAEPQQVESTEVAAPEPVVESVPTIAYTVQAGDTLRSIANAHGVHESAIIDYGPNGISNPELIHPGQELAIPGGTEPVVATQTSEPEPAPEPEPEPEPEPQPDPQPEPEPEPEVQAAPEPQQQQAQSAPATSSAGQQIVNLAMQFQGAPYVWGATGPNSFDCTGFTYYIVNQIIGGGFPRDMHGQAAYGTPVSSDNLQPGDIVFQQNTYQAGMSHAGIYIGGGQFINAANPSVGVVISNLWDDYWGPRYHSAVRIQ